MKGVWEISTEQCIWTWQWK